MHNKLLIAALMFSFASTTAFAQVATESSTNLHSMTPERTDSTKTQYIEHPLEEHGLIRITSDKTYIYKTERAGQKNSVSLRFAPYEPTHLRNPETGSSFAQNYEAEGFPMILFDYEWQLWRSAIGRFGFKVGSGLYTASGHGRFKSTQANPQHTEPLESFTLFLFPNSAGLTYRFQLADRPWLMPYVEGGGIGFTFAEIRDDSKAPKFGASAGAYGVAGAALNLRFLDAKSAWALDREYGISSVYFTGEARVIASTTKYDFSATTFALGFLFDF